MSFSGDLEIRFFIESVTPSEIRGRITAQRSIEVGGVPTGILIGNLLDLEAWLALSVLPACVPPVYYSGQAVSTRFFSYDLETDYFLDAASIEVLAASPDIFLLPFTQRFPSVLLLWHTAPAAVLPSILPADSLVVQSAPGRWRRVASGIESFSVYSYHYDNRTSIGVHFVPYQYEGFAFDYLAPGAVVFGEETLGFSALEYPLTQTLFDFGRFVTDFDGAFEAESHGIDGQGGITWRSYSVNLPIDGLRHFGRLGFPFAPGGWGFAPYRHTPPSGSAKKTVIRKRDKNGKKRTGHFTRN
jgi:hypothetical protein